LCLFEGDHKVRAVSNLSTYFAGALAAALVMNHAQNIAVSWPSLDALVLPGEAADPAITVNRVLKGDRWAPDHAQRDSRPANAPLEVVDFPTGSTGERRSVHAPGSPINNNTVINRAAPRDLQPGKRALPMGCESAFGRLAAPPLAQVPGRCII
jgi:hypothetical protein